MRRKDTMKLIKNILLILLLIILLITCTYFVKSKFNKNENKNINIVFTTDLNYVEYTKVAIKSAIYNKKPDSVYNINVLCVDIPNEKCSSFKNFKEKNVNINIKHLSISSIKDIGNYHMDHYVTRADLFKFLMPDIFPNHDKILYIDSDTIIRKDLRDLYNTNIEKYYLAAMKKPGIDYDYPVIHKKFLFFEYKIGTYTYNCGVLLLNLKKMRNDDIKTKLIQAKNSDTIRTLQTQKSFNDVIPIQEIKVLSPIYNTYARWPNNAFKKFNLFVYYFPYTLKYYNIHKLRQSSVIAHFAGRNKPWKFHPDDGYPFVEEWWKYAKMINPDWHVEKENREF